MKKIILILAVAIVLPLAASCSGKGFADGKHENYYDMPANAAYYMSGNETAAPEDPAPDGYDQEKVIENPFVPVSENAVSTFSADVDTASYTMFRRLVKQGYSLSELRSTAGAGIRTEELINYFKFNVKAPENGELFGVSMRLIGCEWNGESSLLTVSLSTEVPQTRKANNLVFLIDVSGSMSSEDKLPLLQKCFSYLTSALGEDDVVSIVTYSSGEKVVLEGCEGNKADKIQQAIDSLKANGSTNGEAGMKKAYEIAEKYYKPDGNNRIIMASDGDLNVGISSVEEIEKFVSEKRGTGVYLSVLGFGYGNYRDAKMETIADKGNGVYYYIDGETEAEKIFGDDLLSTLYAVAGDVKLQLTFDPSAVSEYRLIGYENRLLSEQDFENDTKDAGEIGAGHTVTVCYELKMKDGYESAEKLFDLSVRYKKPGSEKSELNTYTAGPEIVSGPDEDSYFITALCELGMILHQSDFMDDTDTLTPVLAALEKAGETEDAYRKEFVGLIRMLADKR